MEIGDRIKSERERTGTTREELSKSLNIKYSTLSGYENGSRKPDYDILLSLADFFNVSTDFLLGRTIVRKHIESNDVVATKLINLFDMLNDDGKQMIMNYVEDLSTLKKYTK